MNTPSERGDWRSYLAAVGLLWACVLGLVLLYQALDPVLMEAWGARSGPHIDQHWLWGARLWRLMHRSTSAPATVLWIPLLWTLAGFLVQCRVARPWARALNRAHLVVVLVLGLLALLSFFGLMLMPMGGWPTPP